MLLELKRRATNAIATEGDLFVDGVFFCYTLEDTIRTTGPKITGKTAIPTGTYQVKVTLSNRFGKLMPILLGVPNFEGIRIHCGNTSADTEGCILVGTDKTSPDDNFIGGSRVAFDKLFPVISRALETESVTIKITNPPLAQMVA